jgi:hypothetical protein
MATTIVTKSGSGAPTASNLVAGELAVDLTNKRLYTENSSGTVLELGSALHNNVDGSNSVAIGRLADFIGNASGDSQLTFWNSDQTAVVSYIENQAAGAHMFNSLDRITPVTGTNGAVADGTKDAGSLLTAGSAYTYSCGRLLTATKTAADYRGA